MIYLKTLYIFLMAIVLALLEVQIEGKNGWAANLPTWRPKPTTWYAKLYKKMMGNKEMTGYHLSMFGFVSLIFHLPFFFGVNWSFSKELDILAIYMIFIVIWDYLWFVVNPHFTIRDFKGDHTFWHQKWFLKLPKDYWFSIFISFIIAIFNKIFFDCEYLKNWFLMLTLLIILTTLAKIFIKIFKPTWE